MKKVSFAIIFLVLSCIPLITIFLAPGYPKTDDGLWAVVRLAEMHRELKDLQIPPRWSSFLNHGYGYPLFLYTYHLPFYIGEVFHLIGFDLITATKLVFIFSIGGSVVTMFILGNSLAGVFGGTIASLLYLYIPFRLINLYNRGSIGESVAFVLYPLLFWLVRKFVQTKKRHYFFIFSFCIGLLIINHNATALLFLPFLFGWMLLQISIAQPKIMHYFFGSSAFILGLAYSAYFWLPAMVEKNFIRLSQTPLADKTRNVVTLFELFGFGYHNVDLKYYFPITLLGIALIAVGISVVKKRYQKETIVLFFFTTVSLFLITPFSLRFWQLPVFKEIDFPWRMFGISSFMGCVLAAFAAQTKFTRFITVIFTIALIFGSSQLISVRDRIYENESYFYTNDSTTTSADELQPVWVTIPAKNRPGNFFSIDSGTVETQTVTSKKITGVVKTNQQSLVTVNALNFPGWQLYINGKQSPLLQHENTGLMKFEVNSGETDFMILFQRTLIRKIADTVTVTTFIISILLWIFSKKYFRL